MLQLVLGISSTLPFIYYKKVQNVCSSVQLLIILGISYISTLIYLTFSGLYIPEKWKAISSDSQQHTVWASTLTTQPATDKVHLHAVFRPQSFARKTMNFPWSGLHSHSPVLSTQR